MAGNLTALAVILLGAGCATTGLLLFVSNRGLGRLQAGTTRLSTILLPALMLLLGASLVFAGWLISPPTAERGTIADAGTTLLPSEIPASPAAETTPLPVRSVLLLVWGTPSDQDKASTQAEQDYSRAIGTALTHGLGQANPGLQAEHLILEREQHHQLLSSPRETKNWCDPQWEIVALVDMGATHSEKQGYMPWREPTYLLLECASGRSQQDRGRVTERPGDQHPYQQALQKEFFDALLQFSTAAG